SICRAAAARDRRLRYVRHDRNLGAAPNYNAVFELSSSEYFRWAAHDDVWHPDHLALSVEALDDDPRAVLSFSGAVDIDAEGRRLGRWQFPAELGSADASVRFRAIAYQEETLPIFGLIRTDVMAQTHLHEHYTNCDRVLLAELALHGPFRQVGGDLFLHREHAGRARYAARSRQERLRWYDTSRSSAVYFPEWLWLHGYTRAIRRAPIDSQTRIRCLGALAPHLRNRARFLALDAAGGARRMIRTLKPAGPGTA
ncbi:MAG: glycosyltransferase, partial [Acidimicrobiia bacterium]